MDVKPSETKRRKWSWTPLQIERSDRVMEVVNDLKKYWPLTLRQIYYQLVERGLLRNKLSKYILLSKLVKWMRIDGILPWRALYDGNHRVTIKRGFESLEDFVLQEADYFLEEIQLIRLLTQFPSLKSCHLISIVPNITKYRHLCFFRRQVRNHPLCLRTLRHRF